jgi:hypothetical protein
VAPGESGSGSGSSVIVLFRCKFLDMKETFERAVLQPNEDSTKLASY